MKFLSFFYLLNFIIKLRLFAIAAPDEPKTSGKRYSARRRLDQQRSETNNQTPAVKSDAEEKETLPTSIESVEVQYILSYGFVLFSLVLSL